VLQKFLDQVKMLFDGDGSPDYRNVYYWLALPAILIGVFAILGIAFAAIHYVGAFLGIGGFGVLLLIVAFEIGTSWNKR
jgi:hypothetical protein